MSSSYESVQRNVTRGSSDLPLLPQAPGGLMHCPRLDSKIWKTSDRKGGAQLTRILASQLLLLVRKFIEIL